MRKRTSKSASPSAADADADDIQETAALERAASRRQLQTRASKRPAADASFAAAQTPMQRSARASNSSKRPHYADLSDSPDENDNDDKETAAIVTSPRRANRRPQVAPKSALPPKNVSLSVHRSKRSVTAPKLSKAELRKFKFLFDNTDLFRQFVAPEVLVQVDEYRKKMATRSKGAFSDDDDDDATTSHSKSGTKNRGLHRTHPLSDDDNESEDGVGGDVEDASLRDPVYFQQSPSFVKNGVMRDYQIEGLNWLISLFHHNINGILADEMGLGKTLQTLALLGYLKEFHEVGGPHLLLVPKSTLQNWLNECTKWTPSLKAFVLHGTADERKEVIRDRLKPLAFDICITSYEVCLIEKSALGKIAWEYIVIDEAHRIKNENSILSQIIRLFSSRHRLLLTGTPLQNNLHELWALLNFLLPDVFRSIDAFDAWFKEHSVDQELVVSKLHHLLQPFLLRRLKIEVETALLPKKEIYLYVGMTEMQKKWYQRILTRDFEASALEDATGAKTASKTRLMNIAMQLRKCCNHPYLFDNAEPGPPFTNDVHLIENAAKLRYLDQLLAKLKANGSKVLLFSQMSRMLDIFEDYCFLRNYEYCRIDGQTAHEDRVEAIDDFNRPGSHKFLFLLTTRAGGLGINLVAADIVILYDSDWNPQVDLQAQDRAHRIGQTKQVYVFRFVTENAIEEKILERALQKLRLDQLVIQKGKTAGNAGKNVTASDLMQMIYYGASDILTTPIEGAEKGTAATSAPSESIEELIKRGESKTRHLQEKYSNVGFEDLQRFTLIGEASGADYSTTYETFRNQFAFSNAAAFNLGRRERRIAGNTDYSVDNYYRETFGRRAAGGQNAPRLKFPPLHDYQFFNVKRLTELFEKETFAYRKKLEYKVPVPDDADDDADADDDDQKDEAKNTEQKRKEAEEEQRSIDAALPLTPEEEQEKERLLAEAFTNWTKRDFNIFTRSLERYGRHNLAAVADELEDKDLDEVRRYASVFWKRFHELEDHEKIIAAIEKGERRLEKAVRVQRLLTKKISSECALGDGPNWRTLHVDYKFVPSTYNVTAAQFSDDEDRFLLYHLGRIGFQTDDVYERMHDEIRKSFDFQFDWFFKTRSPAELAKRCKILVHALEREQEARKAKQQHASAKQAADGTAAAGASGGVQPSLPPPNGTTAASKAASAKRAKDAPVDTLQTKRRSDHVTSLKALVSVSVCTGSGSSAMHIDNLLNN